MKGHTCLTSFGRSFGANRRWSSNSTAIASASFSRRSTPFQAGELRPAALRARLGLLDHLEHLERVLPLRLLDLLLRGLLHEGHVRDRNEHEEGVVVLLHHAHPQAEIGRA